MFEPPGVGFCYLAEISIFSVCALVFSHENIYKWCHINDIFDIIGFILRSLASNFEKNTNITSDKSLWVSNDNSFVLILNPLQKYQTSHDKKVRCKTF